MGKCASVAHQVIAPIVQEHFQLIVDCAVNATLKLFKEKLRN